MQVHVTNVATTNRWVGQSDLGVEVGAIKVDLATVVVDDLASLLLTILRRISWSDRFIVLTS